MNDVLTRHAWYRSGSDPSSATAARYVFRPDGRGRYEPAARNDLPPAERAESMKAQEFRYVIWEDVLRIKFNRARDWFETKFRLEPGPRQYAENVRFARHRLVLDRDPYAFVMSGKAENQTAWESDAGAGLPD